MKRSVALYIPDFASGGAERANINLVPELEERGFSVTLLVQKAEGALLPAIPKTVRIVSLDASRTIMALGPLIKFLKKEKPDILMSSFALNNVIAIWAGKLSRVAVKVVVVQQNALRFEKGDWQLRLVPRLYRLFLRRADGIVGVSNGVADNLSEASGVARDRIEVIYNPVITSDFDRDAQQATDHPWLQDDAVPVIIAVGRLVPQKDFPTLLKAFALSARSRPMRLIILGEGPLKKDLEKEAEDLGIKDVVDFAGYNINPLPMVKKSRLFVMSSIFEGFGNVLVEALACGTPIVSTDCNYGPSEILDGGAYGRLVTVGDFKQMSSAIDESLNETPPTMTLQERGRMFSTGNAANHYAALFGKLLPSDARG